MTQTVIYGGAEPLYESLLKFITRSERRVSHAGDEYSIYHTQYASFNVKELFDVLVSETATHPIADSREFDSEVDENAAAANAVIDSHSIQNFYDKREYIRPRQISSAAMTYRTNHTRDIFTEAQLPYSIDEDLDRKQCIADILTVAFAERASRLAYRKFALTGDFRADGDFSDNHCLDEGVTDKEVAFSLRDVVEMYDEHAVLRQPNPTQRTVRTLFDVYEGAGMNPSVREVYGVIVDPNSRQMYEPEDADGRRILTAVGNLGDAAMGCGKSEKRWVNPDEPPLETIKD